MAAYDFDQSVTAFRVWYDGWRGPLRPEEIETYLGIPGWVLFGIFLLWVAAALTVITGWDYFRKATPFLKEDR